MKSRIQALREKLSGGAALRRVGTPLRWLWGLVSHNLPLKLISLVLAILLWNFVIASNTSITRTKIINGLTGYVSGQSTLNANLLAPLEDPSEALSNISVTIEAPQADYARVSADNVQVLLDLSSVRAAGTQEVPLRALTSYGRVTDIVPDALTLTFEALDSRSVPVNAQIVGDRSADRWYNVTRVNPSVLTVSGAASLVRSVTAAYVYEDVSELESPTIAALPYALLDASGAEVPQTLLNRSTSSISVSVDAYPSKELPVSTDLDAVVTGQPAPGYVVQSVTIQPERITVAADGELLDSLSELLIEPVSVEGLNHSLSARARVSALSDFRYVSNEQVYVNVTIAEETVNAWIDDVNVLFTGLSESLTVSYDAVRVYVTGPKRAVERLQAEGVSVTVDLTGLGAGSHNIALAFDTELYPDLTFQSETLSVSLMRFSPDE